MNPPPDQLINQPFQFYLQRRWQTVAAGTLFLFLTNAADVMIPWLIGQAMDRVVNKAPYNDILFVVGQILLVLIFLSTFRFLWRIFWGRFHHGVAEDLRHRIFHRLIHLGPSFYHRNKVGDLISLIANDVNSFRMGVGPGILILLDGLFLLVLIVPIMLSLSVEWTWKTLIFLPLVPILVRVVVRRLSLSFQGRQKSLAEMSGVGQETVSGIRAIKGFSREALFAEQYDSKSYDLQNSSNRVAQWDALFGPVLEWPISVGCVVLLLVGLPQVMQQTVTLGEFFTFYQYTVRLLWPMSAIGIGLTHMQDARAALHRLLQPLTTPIEPEDTGLIEISEFKSLEVKNLTFTYPGQHRPVLKNISLSLQAGEVLGINGGTGSGKSTLFDLLCRHLPAPKNTIFINNLAIEKISKKSLRSVVTVVGQEPFLFSKTIRENVLLGRANADDLPSIFDIVQMDDEIAGWPNGVESVIGEKGVNLSGGQKQRLSLARGLLRKSQLLLLDDALSAVDIETEQLILSHLDALGGSRIVASHRPQSLKKVDRTLTLSEGHSEVYQ